MNTSHLKMGDVLMDTNTKHKYIYINVGRLHDLISCQQSDNHEVHRSTDFDDGVLTVIGSIFDMLPPEIVSAVSNTNSAETWVLQVMSKLPRNVIENMYEELCKPAVKSVIESKLETNPVSVEKGQYQMTFFDKQYLDAFMRLCCNTFQKPQPPKLVRPEPLYVTEGATKAESTPIADEEFRLSPRLRKVLAEAIKDDVRQIVTGDERLAEFCDSLDSMEVIMGIEDEYGIEITDAESDNFKTANDIVLYLTERGVYNQKA